MEVSSDSIQLFQNAGNENNAKQAVEVGSEEISFITDDEATTPGVSTPTAVARTAYSEGVSVADPTDASVMEVYLQNSGRDIQIYNPSKNTYSPDFTNTPIIITPTIIIDGEIVDVLSPLITDRRWSTNGNIKTSELPDGSLRIDSNLVGMQVLQISFRCRYYDSDTFTEVAATANRNILKIERSSDEGTGMSDISDSTWGDLKNVNEAVDSVAIGKYGIEMGRDKRLSLFAITDLISDIVGRSVPIRFLNLDEYDSIRDKGRVLYFIMTGDILHYIFLGETLIAQQGGGEAAGSNGFPYTFPIIL